MQVIAPSRLSQTNCKFETSKTLKYSESHIAVVTAYRAFTVKYHQHICSNRHSKKLGPSSLSSAEAPAGYHNKNSSNRKIESAWGMMGRGKFVPPALSFSFSPASLQHKEASVEERGPSSSFSSNDDINTHANKGPRGHPIATPLICFSLDRAIELKQLTLGGHLKISTRSSLNMFRSFVELNQFFLKALSYRILACR